MLIKQCGSCMHFHPDIANPPAGRCHRFPPNFFAFPMRGPKGELAVQEMTNWPPLTRDAPGCGEFKPILVEG